MPDIPGGYKGNIPDSERTKAQTFFDRGTAVALMVALQYLIFRTKVGMAMRAVSFNTRIAALMGVNVDRVVSFTFEPAHPHDVAQIVDRRGVCVRAGHHCTQPLMKRFGVPLMS